LEKRPSAGVITVASWLSWPVEEGRSVSQYRPGSSLGSNSHLLGLGVPTSGFITRSCRERATNLLVITSGIRRAYVDSSHDAAAQTHRGTNAIISPCRDRGPVW